jgi:hypothetical protein
MLSICIYYVLRENHWTNDKFHAQCFQNGKKVLIFQAKVTYFAEQFSRIKILYFQLNNIIQC